MAAPLPEDLLDLDYEILAERAPPSAARLRELAAERSPPDSWYDEDLTDLFASDSSS